MQSSRNCQARGKVVAALATGCGVARALGVSACDLAAGRADPGDRAHTPPGMRPAAR